MEWGSNKAIVLLRIRTTHTHSTRSAVPVYIMLGPKMSPSDGDITKYWTWSRWEVLCSAALAPCPRMSLPVRVAYCYSHELHQTCPLSLILSLYLSRNLTSFTGPVTE
jgi:hypothetical protein